MVDTFAFYVSNPLESLDKRRRLLAEKNINVVPFEHRYEYFPG